MDKISSPKKGDPRNDRTSEEGMEESIHPRHNEVNITEGGEFLDDAIRMEDLIDKTNEKPLQKISYKHLF